ncbi:MAG TPA: hypothetical protein VF003_06355 [Pseudonocardiaceae bacterium]|jgi:hypothetical protein
MSDLTPGRLLVESPAPNAPGSRSATPADIEHAMEHHSVRTALTAEAP